MVKSHLSDLQKGRLQGEFSARKTTITALARRYGHHYNTVESALQYTGEKKKRALRAVNPEVKQRRALVKRLADKVFLDAEGRPHPEHCTLTSIKNTLPEKYKASRTTVWNDLKALDYVCRSRHRAPTRDPAQLKLRYDFCRGWTKPSKVRLIKKIIFSDEHTVSVNDHTSRTMHVPRTKQWKVIPRERKRLQNIPRVMVWGAVGVGFRSKLILFPQKKADDTSTNPKMTYRLNASAYIRKCLAPIIKDLDGRIFQQDGATPHGRGSENSDAIKYLRRKGVDVLLPWVSNSPDFNMAEHMWPELNRRIAEQHPCTLEELKKAAVRAWESIPQDVIDRICLGFENHCHRVVELKGGCPK